MITRRWFLIGSAAAVGAAAAGLPALEVPAFVAPLRCAVGRIKVYDIDIIPNGAAAAFRDRINSDYKELQANGLLGSQDAVFAVIEKARSELMEETALGTAINAPALRFDVKRLSSEYSLLRFAINPLEAFRWCAIDYSNSFIVLPEDALRISCTPDPGGDAVATIGYVDLEHKHFTDRFEWRNGVATVVDSQVCVAPSFFDDEDDA